MKIDYKGYIENLENIAVRADPSAVCFWIPTVLQDCLGQEHAHEYISGGGNGNDK